MSDLELTPAEKETFARNGAVIRRGAIPLRLIQRARALIDDWYRTQMDRDLIDAYTERTFAPHLGEHPDLLALFHTPEVGALVGSLIDTIQPVSTVQIQIRIPDTEAPRPQPTKAMHVDGVAAPHLDPGELRTFTMLVGIALSDISDPAGGALRYVPGGHLHMAEWFRTEWSLGMTEQVPPHIDTEHGTPVLAYPGDVLLMHHLVPHAVGHNTTTTPRIMAYFRVSHALHAGQRIEALRDPWLEYPVLRALVSE